MDITTFIASHRDSALAMGDYNSYRIQCSRRLLTIRKRLGLTTPKGRKFTSKTPVSAEDVASNHEAWAHGMHMKSIHSADASGKGITGPTRRHILSRLQKASVYANQLEKLLKENAKDDKWKTDILEGRAYCTSLHGAVEFEKQSWEKCLKQYAVAHVIYGALAVSTKKDVFRDLLSTTIDPSIRYSAYQLRLPRTVAVPTLAKRYFPRSDAELLATIEKLDPEALSEESAKAKKGPGGNVETVPKTIRWRTRTVNIEDASIAQGLALVAVAEDGLSEFISSASNSEMLPKEKAAAYDDILIASQDVVDATKHAIDELTEEGVDQGDQRIQALQVTRTAVNYSLVGWRIGRNRVLSGEQDGATIKFQPSTKPRKPRKDGKEWIEREEGTGRKLARLREQVAVYDATLQSLDSVKDLPGVAADEQFIQELEGKRAYFQALKCLSIARSHDLLSNSKNALALFARALDLSSQSLQQPAPPSNSSQSPPNLDIHSHQAEFLHQLLQGFVSQHRALVELSNLSSKSSNARTNPIPRRPLVENLDTYPIGGADLNYLVTYPPKLEPVAVKPLFLDVAWNYIDYPGRAKEAIGNGVKAGSEGKQQKSDDKKEGRKGWFGFGR
ncbi:MAG: hypothetical protein M1827_001824 [Pycnora praestabilis]|nr:MAG: hypothetical protein M1827_001824 [Pycnora praestabilis]